MSLTGFLCSQNHGFVPVQITEHFTLGKDDSCQLRLDDPGVSDRHCRLEQKPDHFLIRDLRSQLGTFVNNTRISEAFLADGDEIRIGEHIFQFVHNPTPAQVDFKLKSRNESWNQALKSLGHVAKTNFPILLLGPSGTGKEVLAQALHEHSSRNRGQLVSVNCSALTETLVESELFGHVKGSFTGAINDRKGAFESARGGTLFLDEIGDLPYGIQAKLLRALENNEIRPVGADRTVQTDVRIIAATHQNLNEKIQQGLFRSDLYYRLNVITIKALALKDRMEDFDDLLYSFAKTLRVRFSFNAIQKLKKHDWPGNIRELKNTVSRASAFFPGQQIDESHLPQLLETHSQSELPHSDLINSQLPVIKEIEKQMIIKRLVANQGNQRRTANDLGMPKSTLHDRLKFYRIDPRQFSESSSLI